MAYVGLPLQPYQSAALCAIPHAQLHVTLVHFSKPDKATTLALSALFSGIARYFRPLYLPIISIQNWDVGVVLRLEETSELQKLRDRCVHRIESQGCTVTKDFAFNPHITVLDPKPTYLTEIVVASELEFVGGHGLTRFIFPFESEEE